MSGKLARVLLRLAVRDAEVWEGLLGDLDEEYAQLQAAGDAPDHPGLWYWSAVLGLSSRFLLERTVGDRFRRHETMGRAGQGRRTMIEALLRDLRSAYHVLRRSPGFTLLAVLTLAVGIGANVAMFSVMDAALLRPLPYPEPDRLVLALGTFPGEPSRTVSAHDYYDYRDQSPAFQSLSAITAWPWVSSVTGGDEPVRVPVAWVSVDLFRTLGVAPLLGRDFAEGEGERGASDVVIVSHAFWQQLMGGTAEAVGSTLTVDGVAHTVVGVMPPRFRIWEDADLWRPLRIGEAFAEARRYSNFIMIGRLRPDIPIGQAQSQVDVIAAELADEYPGSNRDEGLSLTELQEGLTRGYRTKLLLLVGAVGLVLLVACGNIAALLLARGFTRRTELSVRAALGASRLRVAHQLLSESLLIALTGGVFGTVLAVWLHRLIVGFLPFDLPQTVPEGPSLPMLAVALLLSLATGLLIGIVPALRAPRGDLAEALKAGARTLDRRGAHLRSGLVAGQVALSMVLLVSSGLLVRSFAHLSGVDPGFDSRDLLTAGVELPRTEYRDAQQRVLFFSALEERLKGVPGVVGVAMVNRLPVRSLGGNTYVYPEGERPPQGTPPRTAVERHVMPGYFEAMKIPVLRGRGILPTDRPESPPVLVINQSMAEMFFPGDDPIGKRLVIDYDEETVLEVVGVVGDVRFGGPAEGASQAMYHSVLQEPLPRMDIAIRTTGDPTSVIAALKGAVRELDPDLPVSDVETMERLIARTVGDQRVLALTLALFAWVALILAALGLYGVLSYHVSQRVSELGLRLTLGAGTREIASLVLSRGVRLVAAGITVGAVVALAVTRFLEHLLFGVQATDPTTFVAVTLLYAVVGTAACLTPVWRAVRVDPLVALQAE